MTQADPQSLSCSAGAAKSRSDRRKGARYARGLFQAVFGSGALCGLFCRSRGAARFEGASPGLSGGRKRFRPRAHRRQLLAQRHRTHIRESYAYDYLAVPVKVRPLTAAAMPEHSAGFRVWTIKLQPGIFFTDDLVFQGRKRELVAQDYVYSIKRYADPAVKSPHWSSILD